jgi:hypothetical protein
LDEKNPKLGRDDVVAKLIQAIVDQLLEADVNNGLNPKLYVYEDFGKFDAR